MNKTITILLIAILCISSVTALSFTREEYISFTDLQIEEYMTNNMLINNVIIKYPMIFVYYNLTYVVENKVTNKIDVKVSSIPTYLHKDPIFYCLNLYNYDICGDALILNDNILTYIENNKTKTVESTYHQAFKQGITYYNQAIALKNKIIAENNELSIIELFMNNTT